MQTRPSPGLLLNLATVLLTPSAATAQARQAEPPTLPLVFLPTQHGTAGGAHFFARHRSFTIGLHDDRIVLQREEQDRGVALHLEFAGGHATPVAEGELPGRIHSLVGERSTWRSRTACATVRYPELWPGVDLVVHDCAGELEYDLLLKPGADLDRVAIRPLGADAVTIDSAGSLVFHSALGDVRQAAPKTWEVAEDGMRRPVPCRFELRTDGEYGFHVEREDASRRLVIDPVLSWATYFGSSVTDVDLQQALAVDAAGFVYVASSTYAGQVSVPFPTTAGVYQPSSPGGEDGYVAKFDPNASGAAQLVWCTFLGGSSRDSLTRIALTASGDVVVAGYTQSPNFPTTAGAYKTTRTVMSEGLVAVLSAEGANLLYATFLCGTTGSGFDARGLAVEPDGRILVAGETPDATMPTTVGAYQTATNGGQEMWFARVDRTQTGAAQLVWATYFGGGSSDTLSSIFISPALPGIVSFHGTTNGAATLTHDFLTGSISEYDWVVGQLDPAQSGAAQRRFVHVVGDGYQAGGIAVATNGEVFAAGTTHSDPSFSRVNRFSAAGALIASRTLFQGCTAENVLVAASGVVTVTGVATGPLVTVTPDAVDSTFGGPSECYVCQIDATLTQVLFASYLGGSGSEYTYPHCAHMAGSVLTMLMDTTSNDNLTTANAYQGANAGGSDAHLVRFDLPAGGAGIGPRDVELLDVDGDGDRDVATANEGSDDVSLRANDGAGALAGEVRVALTTSDAAPVALARGDLDDDGSSDDLAVACQVSGTLVLLTDPASASPGRSSLGVAGLRPTCVATGDLDANPIDDVVVGREGEPLAGGAGLAVVRNGAAAVDLSIPSPHPTKVIKVALADLDGDGDQDLAAIAHGSPDELLLFAGDGAGALAFAGAITLPTSGLANGVCCADLDRDGDNDVAVMLPQLFPPAQSLRIHQRTSSGALGPVLFTVGSDIATSGTFAVDLACGDLEDDSIEGFLARVDVAQADVGSGTVTIRHGYTGSDFGSTTSPAVGTNPIAVAIGDLDGDGCDDVVVANQGSDDVTVLLTTPPALAQVYGTNCGGPTISAVGSATSGNPAFGVSVSNARATAPMLLMFSVAPADLALPPSTCRLLLANPIAQLLLFTDGSGQATFTFGVPGSASLLGADAYFQGAVFHAPGGAFANTLDISDALRVQVGS